MKYKGQDIIYIEYQDSKPFSVCTAIFGKWSLQHFDFEPDCHDKDYYIHLWSGSGGMATEIYAPNYSDKSKGVAYWMHAEAKLEGEPKNITKVENPIKINGSINPFDSSREVFHLTYCKYCGHSVDEDYCKHLDTNDDGELVYMDGELHDD